MKTKTNNSETKNINLLTIEDVGLCLTIKRKASITSLKNDLENGIFNVSCKDYELCFSYHFYDKLYFIDENGYTKISNHSKYFDLKNLIETKQITLDNVVELKFDNSLLNFLTDRKIKFSISYFENTELLNDIRYIHIQDNFNDLSGIEKYNDTLLYIKYEVSVYNYKELLNKILRLDNAKINLDYHMTNEKKVILMKLIEDNNQTEKFKNMIKYL